MWRDDLAGFRLFRFRRGLLSKFDDLWGLGYPPFVPVPGLAAGRVGSGLVGWSRWLGEGGWGGHVLPLA